MATEGIRAGEVLGHFGRENRGVFIPERYRDPGGDIRQKHHMIVTLRL